MLCLEMMLKNIQVFTAYRNVHPSMIDNQKYTKYGLKFCLLQILKVDLFGLVGWLVGCV